MSVLGILFAAERVKWRKSWLLLVTIVAPLCQVAFLGVVCWFSDARIRMFRPGFQFWVELNFIAWNLVVMPLTTALVSELSWEQEREARAWNHLWCQPFPRSAHFMVKLVGHAVLAWGSLILFALLVVAGGYVLQTNSDLLMGSLPWPLFLRFLGYSALALLAIVAFHTWLSMWSPGLWLAVATAGIGSWLAVRMVGNSVAAQFLPWGLASQAMLLFERWRVLPWGYSPGALLLALGIAIGGIAHFARRDRVHG
ncbi:ABC transporter permease [Geothrix sp. 21YS21S-4]|uniref:ABC transporter permease n=1 Tax=Geothrix sp. 21YS21S-4 TaxID=3068889 RepID=UPI0027B89627|nr:ABC transporter permease [Geothrix sp. 21YS21S-4]